LIISGRDSGEVLKRISLSLQSYALERSRSENKKKDLLVLEKAESSFKLKVTKKHDDPMKTAFEMVEGEEGDDQSLDETSTSGFSSSAAEVRKVDQSEQPFISEAGCDGHSISDSVEGLEAPEDFKKEVRRLLLQITSEDIVVAGLSVT
jgi:hypothetical protein